MSINEPSHREHGYYWVWDVNMPRDMPYIAIWSQTPGYEGWWINAYHYDAKYIRVLSDRLIAPIVPDDMN